MIVRILGEGQFEIPDNAEERLSALDAALDAAVDARDESAFTTALSNIVAAVREVGTPLDPTRIVPSDLALPAPGSSLNEVLELLDTEAPAES